MSCLIMPCWNESRKASKRWLSLLGGEFWTNHMVICELLNERVILQKVRWMEEWVGPGSESLARFFSWFHLFRKKNKYNMLELNYDFTSSLYLIVKGETFIFLVFTEKKKEVSMPVSKSGWCLTKTDGRTDPWTWASKAELRWHSHHFFSAYCIGIWCFWIHVQTGISYREINPEPQYNGVDLICPPKAHGIEYLVPYCSSVQRWGFWEVTGFKDSDSPTAKWDIGRL